MPLVEGSLEDREQIRELYARCAITIDDCRFEDWVHCFTADGVFESPIHGTHSGHDGLRKFCDYYKDTWQGAQVRHMIVNVSFEVEGDHGNGSCGFIYFHIKDANTELVAVGGYRDELRKVDGNSLFAHRKVWINK